MDQPDFFELKKEIFNEINKNLSSRNFKFAENNLKKILELDSENLKALFLLGSVYLETKQLDDSIKYLNKVIELDPNIGNAYTNLGVAYIKLRKFNYAKKYILKAIHIKNLPD